MEKCSWNHEEIIYDTTSCPLCTALIYIEEIERKIKELEDKE